MTLEIAELGSPILRQHAALVDFDDGFSEERVLAEVVAELMEAMEARNGVGIAAPQLFVSKQILIIASRPSPRYPDAPQMAPVVMINPTVLSQSKEICKGWEGCLSVPGLRGLVSRSVRVEVSFFDVSGKAHHLALEEFPARIFLHEYDHLIGLTYLDRVDSHKDLLSEKEYMALTAVD